MKNVGTIKLMAGRHYRTRAGMIEGPMQCTNGVFRNPAGKIWAADGVWYRGAPHPRDLVQECDEYGHPVTIGTVTTNTPRPGESDAEVEARSFRAGPPTPREPEHAVYHNRPADLPRVVAEPVVMSAPGTGQTGTAIEAPADGIDRTYHLGGVGRQAQVGPCQWCGAGPQELWAVTSTDVCGWSSSEPKVTAAPGPWSDFAEVGYERLAGILNEAHNHAAVGKGRERHARGATPFHRQPIVEIGRMVGPGFELGQAMKKAQEATGMLSRGERDRAVAECLGAINYLAAAVILIREGGDA